MNFQSTSFEYIKRQRTPDEPPAASRDITQIGDIQLDARRFRVWQGNTEIALTTTGFRILKVLMTNPGFVMTRDELLDVVWGEDTNICHRTVDTAVKRLRDGFLSDANHNPIRTVRGVGYAFDETYCSS